MRRIAATILLIAAVVAVLASGSAAGGDDGTYQVRAIFDNTAFLVEGEEVRVAGANVGTVADVEVTMGDESVHEDGRPEPGKAAVVLQIDDPGFQDFREDASCLIRPQSLLGEKFVECEPTQPRAAGSEPPPPLEVIEDGEPGEGQRFLPLEQNGKAVDLDLINNIMREPYVDRFRIILNELGAGLAARGEELAEIVERANPALRETDEVLAILARQNRQLAALASDGDAVLAPLARDRDRITGFIDSAEVVGAATAERSADLEEGLAKLPQTLREVRLTMGELERLAEAGTPAFTQLGLAAPAATRATKALGPFADSATGALISLGDASAASQEPLVASDPVIRNVRKLARSAAAPSKDLSKFLRTLRKGDGFRNLLRSVYRATGSFNGFDSFGHFLRAVLLITNCNDYVVAPQSGCIANFLQATTTSAADLGEQSKDGAPRRERSATLGDATAEGGAQSEAAPGPSFDSGEATGPPPEAESGATGEPATPPEAGVAPEADAAPEADGATAPDTRAGRLRMDDAQMLLDFLIGDQHAKRDRGGSR
jgi:phospholipid/cholesterol/gamma-HCH transport system substrate-binding protein